MNKTWACAFGVIILMVATVSWTAPVPDTGQMKCYDIEGNTISALRPDRRSTARMPTTAFIRCPTLNWMTAAFPAEFGHILDHGEGQCHRPDLGDENRPGWRMNFSDPHDADNLYYWHDSNPATNGGNAGTPGNGMNTEDFIKTLNDIRLWRLHRLAAADDQRTDIYCQIQLPYPEPTLESGYFPNTNPLFIGPRYLYGIYDYAWGVDFSIGYNNGYFKDRV